jgi:uncharacterized membrane protein YqjE
MDLPADQRGRAEELARLQDEIDATMLVPPPTPIQKLLSGLYMVSVASYAVFVGIPDPDNDAEFAGLMVLGILGALGLLWAAAGLRRSKKLRHALESELALFMSRDEADGDERSRAP